MCENCNSSAEVLYAEPADNKQSLISKIKSVYRNGLYNFYDYKQNIKNKKILKRCIKSDSGLIKHAITEFKIAGWMDENNHFDDPLQELICANVLEMMESFCKQGHSGTSAYYAIDLFKELASFGILKPLTGEDNEWCLVDEETNLYQNTRCFNVFKENGFTYDTNGRIFSENGNKDCLFTCTASRTFVTFPYKPTKKYVHLDGELTDELRDRYIQLELYKWEEYKKQNSAE